MEIEVEKCKGKFNVPSPAYGQEPLQVPSHTTLEQEVKAIEDYVTVYSSDLASSFYEKAKAKLDKILK